MTQWQPESFRVSMDGSGPKGRGRCRHPAPSRTLTRKTAALKLEPSDEFMETPVAKVCLYAALLCMHDTGINAGVLERQILVVKVR